MSDVANLKMQKWASQLRKGLGDLVILAALLEGESYGYDLLQRINRIEGLKMTESTVYPVLARLTRDRFIEVRSAPSPSGPRRRYYQLTKLGRTRLTDMTELWAGINSAVHRLLKGEAK